MSYIKGYKTPSYHGFVRIILAMIVLATGLNNPCKAQVNAEQVTAIGKNVLSMDDYMLAIHYFNLAIKAKDYLAEPYFYRALAKMNLDDFKGAEEDCTTAIARSKFMTEAYKLRGFVRQQMGQDSLALDDYKYGLTQNPTDREFLFYKSIAELNLKRYEEADSTLSMLIRANPKFYEAMTARAQLKVETGDTIGALEDIEKSVNISKSQAYPYALRAQIYAQQESWPDAIKAMDEIVRFYPEDASLFLNRAYLKYRDDDYGGALQDYNEAIHLDPYNPDAFFNRALLEFEVMEYELAAEDFSRVLDLDAGNFHARYNRVLVNLNSRQYKKAEADLNIIIKKYPRFYPAYYALAECRNAQGDEKGAVRNMLIADDLIRKYVKNPKKNPLDRPTIDKESNMKKARAGDKEENEMEMMEKFNQLITTEIAAPQNLTFSDKYKGKVQDRETSIAPEPLFHLSFVAPDESLKAIGSYFKELTELNSRNYISETIFLSEDETPMTEYKIEDAFRLVEKYNIAVAGSNPRAVDFIARGILFTMLRNYESALADFNKALELMPDYPVALMGKGYASAMLMHSDRNLPAVSVIDTYSRIIEKNPVQVYAWYNKGSVEYEIGSYAAAEESFSRAIDLNKELGQAYYNRGLARMQQGKRNEAFSDFSKAGELGILQGYRVMKSLK